MFIRRIRLDLTSSLASLVMLANLFFFCSYAQAGQVALAWDASTSSGVAGYEINYGQTSGSYASQVDVGNQTSYTVAGLSDGATYYFAAKAYDSGKTIWSGFSNEVSATTPSPPPTAPTAGFDANPTSGPAPLTVTFTDTSTGDITAWSWNFGDGTTSTAKNAAKTYTNPGDYTVSLTVTGPAGSNTATRTISVATAAPVANFTATPISGAAPLAVSFTNSSTGTVSDYSWSFGDGGTSTAPSPAYTYTSAGTYTVSLTATGPGGSNTKTQNGYITVSASGSNAGLVGAYNFEEASGTTVVDASGKGNHGIISGATRTVSGRYGKALVFDGVNDWVTINDAPSLDLTTGVTLEAWVYPITGSTNWLWQTVLVKEQPNGWGGVYYLASESDRSQPEFAVFTDSWHKVYGGPWLSPNTWAHVAGTYDGTTERLYVNGTEVANQQRPGSIEITDGKLRIGGSSTWGEFLKGRIDEARVYNRALTASEIQNDMSTSVAVSSPPILLVGTQTIGPMTDSNPQGKAQACQISAATTGWVTDLSVYVDTGSTATQLVVGLYSDTNGHPNTRLVRGTLQSPVAGDWNKIPLTIKVNAGTTYWIALLSPSGVLQFRDGGASQRCETSAQSTLTTLPSTWTPGTVYNEGPLSAYGAGYP